MLNANTLYPIQESWQAKTILTLASFPEKVGGEEAPNPNGNSLVDSKDSDERRKGDEGYGVDDDDDNGDDIEYFWKEVGLPFITGWIPGLLLTWKLRRYLQISKHIKYTGRTSFLACLKN